MVARKTRQRALFDTTILIDYLIGIADARTELDRYRERSISIITWMEVMAGVGPEHQLKTRAFLATFQNLPISAAVAERAVDLRKQRRIKLPDAIILATAEIAGCILVTRNTRDFSADDPGVRIPYQL
jgi:predicted nucleic acid-binding protein